MSKLMKGDREIRADEIPKILRFFNVKEGGPLTEVQKQMLALMSTLTDQEQSLLLGQAAGTVAVLRRPQD